MVSVNSEKKILAFLDTNIFAYLFRNEKRLNRLFEKDVLEKVKYVVNPIVIQELFLAGDSFAPKDELEKLTEQFEVIPVDIIRSEILLKKVRNLRNRVAHSNDLLILGSAQNCDYLISYDKALTQFGKELEIPILTPEEFLNEVVK